MRLSARAQTRVSGCVFYCVLVVFVPSSVYVTVPCKSLLQVYVSLSADEVFVEVITPYGSLVFGA